MPTGKKGGKKKKKGSSFNQEEMISKGELLEASFPDAAVNVANMLKDKSFPVVYQEMKHKWHLFEYASKMKDMYIHKLKEDLDLIDEQKVIVHQLQIESIDKILADTYTRSKKYFNEYERRRNAIITDRNCFISHNIKLSRSEQDWLQSYNYLLHEDNKEYNEFFFQDIRLAQYEKRQQFIMEMNYYGEWVLQVMKQACERIQRIYDDYVENTREKKALYDILRDQNSKDEVSIDEFNKKIAWLQVQQKKASDTVSKTKNIASSILDLEAEKSIYDDAQNVLRQRFVTEAEADQRKLDELSQISNACIQELQEDLKLAEDILKYALLCSKYETVVEKAQPYSSLILSIEMPIDKKFSRFKQMHRLLYRMAQTDLECDYMECVKEKYEKENATLEEAVRDVLKNYGSQAPNFGYY
uniref:Coiled-coil domain-containing protein 65 n=1 Tax=Lygus hesperus TaxID=30085 RepID=A0A0K8SUA7_LYGHE